MPRKPAPFIGPPIRNYGRKVLSVLWWSNETTRAPMRKVTGIRRGHVLDLESQFTPVHLSSRTTSLQGILNLAAAVVMAAESVSSVTPLHRYSITLSRTISWGAEAEAGSPSLRHLHRDAQQGGMHLHPVEPDGNACRGQRACELCWELSP